MIFITAKFPVRPEHADAWPEISRAFTEATRAEEGCLWFEWSRSLDDSNEYVLVEAFRQSFLAVSAAHFPFGDGKNYFVINEMNTAFKNFLFQLPATLGYHVLDFDENDRRARHRARIVAWQNGVECASAEVSFTVYSAQIISGKEADLARSVTEQMLCRHAEATAPAIAAVA